MASQSSPTRFGKYDLLTLLATGGMAEIWLATVAGAAGFEKVVVIKRLLQNLAQDREYVQMFLDEARINARLSHTNIVQVYELGQVEGSYFLAMEYVAGFTVGAIGRVTTKRLGEVPQAVACGVVAQACAGLHYAHELTQPDGTPLEIIHRDLTPQNLIVTFEGVVKVVDFGIAKAAGRDHETASGMVKGTYTYMSPEQCLGQPLDHRSDVFGLGIVLFELCTSRRLFKRKLLPETFDAISRAKVPRPRALSDAISSEVEAIILRALELDPRDRFANAGEMQDALEQAMHRSRLRGSRLDLERFLAEHFAAERSEQEELLRRARRGEVPAGPNLGVLGIPGAAGDDEEVATALFERAKSGTASPASAAAVEPAYGDGPTTIDPHGSGASSSHEETPSLTSDDPELDDLTDQLERPPLLVYFVTIFIALLVACALYWLLT